jgi:lipopolysaccharide transport system permease protein
VSESVVVAQTEARTPRWSQECGVVRIAARRGWLALDTRELWAYRELLYFLVWRDIKVRYKQTVFGAAWAVLQPLSTVVMFTLCFGVLAGIPSEGLPYPVFYFCALLPWTYFAGAMQGVTNIVVEQQRVITKVYFPRVLLPIAAVVSGLVDFAIAFFALIGVMAWYQVVPTIAVVWLPGFVLLTVLTALAVGLWLSALNALYRDVRYILPFLVQLWMFASPVAYPSSLVPERWRALYGANPIAGVIEGFRWALAGHGEPPGAMLAVSAGAVLLLLLGGLVYFHSVEGTVADVV